jgi:CRISPR-associated protein (TIGR02710 family)
MEWDDAYELLKNPELSDSILGKTTDNKKFLGALVHLYNKMDPKNKKDQVSIHNPKEPYIMILADLMNNAHRRIEEGKYDDAISRLYRATELISQIMLLDKGIDEINDRIYFKDIKQNIKNPSELEKYKSRVEKQDTGGLRKDMGARAKFQLLKEMGDDRGWVHYSNLRSDMENRNNSIMAHGLKPVGKDAAERFYKSVLEFSYDIFTKEKIEGLLNGSRYPKL